MSVTISIQFLTGRAHLHHWQAHHSDGKVDWPPSPWRLLRALVAVAGRGLTTLPEVDYIASTGKKPKAPRKRPIALGPPVDYVSLPDNWHAAESIDIIPLSRLTALLASLSCAPEVWLPKTSGGHTRQFFPIHEGRIVRPTGSAIFDSFAVVQKDQAICYHWPNIVLEPRDQRLKDLEVILQRMTYFGRAESWCQASVILAAPGDIDGVHHYVTHWPCICLEDGSRPPGREHHDYTLERKLAALPLDEVNGLNLASEVRELLPRTKRVSSARPKNDEAFAKLLQSESPDRLLLRCLLRESGQDMKDGLERPIGTRWVHYAVPRSIYDLPRPIRKRPQRRPQLVHVVRYSLNTATIHRPVLPPLTDTLLVADKFRSAALALYCAKHNNSKHLTPRNLCGREEDESLCR
ncbi:MAG: hypothetical protein RBS57_16445, partial [Desulforhabdus sp.]|nr:hypothetical protein [Desulforhabdus sp.]